MNIEKIYEKYSVPPNLQKHMKRVAEVANFIKIHWKGPWLDWEIIQKSALLHDIGNIVKFDLDKYSDLLGTKKDNVSYWKNVQKKMIEKYGSDDHEATKKILPEIKIDKKIIDIILKKSFGNSIKTAGGNDWYLKILLYSDLRVLPSGLGTLNDRFDDIRKRMPKYTSRPNFERLLDACRNIEKQIQEQIDVPISEIKI
ncbi:MAG: HD domain-containing protein [Patescibacteria group bacterium]